MVSASGLHFVSEPISSFDLAGQSCKLCFIKMFAQKRACRCSQPQSPRDKQPPASVVEDEDVLRVCPCSPERHSQVEGSLFQQASPHVQSRRFQQN